MKITVFAAEADFSLREVLEECLHFFNIVIVRKCTCICSSVKISRKFNNSLRFRALYGIILGVIFSEKIYTFFGTFVKNVTMHALSENYIASMGITDRGLHLMFVGLQYRSTSALYQGNFGKCFWTRSLGISPNDNLKKNNTIFFADGVNYQMNTAYE